MVRSCHYKWHNYKWDFIVCREIYLATTLPNFFLRTRIISRASFFNRSIFSFLLTLVLIYRVSICNQLFFIDNDDNDNDNEEKVANKCFSIQGLVCFLFISPHDIVDYPCQNCFSLGLNGKTKKNKNKK